MLSQFEQINKAKKIAEHTTLLEAQFSGLNLKIEKNPKIVPATRLRSPSLEYDNDQREPNTGLGSWNLKQRRFSKYVKNRCTFLGLSMADSNT
jgi:hypothetical protein